MQTRDSSPNPAPVRAAEPSFAHVSQASFIDWSAVVAGAALASAVSFVLLTFVTSIGFSIVPVGSNSTMSAGLIGSLAALMILAQQIAAFLAGGYVAGRMRSRWMSTTGDEVEFRDGLHGGLVWAVGVAIGAALFFSTAGGAVRLGADAVGRPAAALASNAPVESVIDTLLRPQSPGNATPATGRTEGSTAAEIRAELGRILFNAVTPGRAVTAQDRTYVAAVIAQRTGVTPQEAEARLNAAIAQATEAARTAKRATVIAALIAGLSLILSFAAAWWAGVVGGRHRDNSVPARFRGQSAHPG